MSGPRYLVSGLSRGAETDLVRSLALSAEHGFHAQQRPEVRLHSAERKRSVAEGRKAVQAAIGEAVTAESTRLKAAATRTAGAISTAVAKQSRDVSAAGTSGQGAVKSAIGRAHERNTLSGGAPQP